MGCGRQKQITIRALTSTASSANSCSDTTSAAGVYQFWAITMNADIFQVEMTTLFHVNNK
jgi:hypothetical protein